MGSWLVRFLHTVDPCRHCAKVCGRVDELDVSYSYASESLAMNVRLSLCSFWPDKASILLLLEHVQLKRQTSTDSVIDFKQCKNAVDERDACGPALRGVCGPCVGPWLGWDRARG